MIIQPIIKGQVAKSCHPVGCAEAVAEQIAYVRKAVPIARGPRKVLVLGASSGFGLASRIALAFGGARADTIGVAFERGPSDKGVGSAGWYNLIHFSHLAKKEGLITCNFVGDAFSPAMRRTIADYIRDEFGGSLDLVVYSLATGVRPDPQTGELIRSTIKPIGAPAQGYTVNLEKDCLEEQRLDPASDQEIDDTVKVMGGEDWESWIRFLRDEGLLAEGCQTLAFSYIGPAITHAIYHHGTLGRAKAHLHQTADRLDSLLKAQKGAAHVVVCKALVTKASVFIPGLSPYLLALFRVMKAMGLHEGCIEQMQRLYAERIYRADGRVPVDDARLVRIDDREQRADVQEHVAALLAEMTPENFPSIGDYDGYKGDFLKLNGFGFDSVDYARDVDLALYGAC
jgi:enoyl-[acyl-carrier protein] reductase/trans-2-enoyl-CoA reductase (NAD+)